MRRKSFAYVMRKTPGGTQILAFASHEEPGYEVPKGSLEGGETPREAVLREALEESGLTFKLVEELGVTQWHDEEQHFFVLHAPEGVPDTFEHIVTGEGGDRGSYYRYRWFDLAPALDEVLVQGSNRFLTELLERYG